MHHRDATVRPYDEDAATDNRDGHSAAARSYASFASQGRYLPKRQTLFPIPKLIRCAATPGLFGALSALAQRSAPRALLDHLALYRGDRVILEWHDAFANAMLLDGSSTTRKPAKRACGPLLCSGVATQPSDASPRACVSRSVVGLAPVWTRAIRDESGCGAADLQSYLAVVGAAR